MSDYTNAPAVELLATRCCACSRPLLDAVSVEAGMGPTCRAKHGYGVAQSEPSWDVARAACDRAGVALPEGDDARRAANVLVHRVAADPQAPAVPHLCAAISALGFETVAAAIAAHLIPVTVRVEATGPVLAVDAGELTGETFDRFLAAMRAVPGRWFDRETKRNCVPARQRAALWEALRAVFAPGTVVIGRKVAVL